MSKAQPLLSREQIEGLAAHATQRQQSVEMAGFLTHDDGDSLFVADPQGTWVIPHDSVVFMGEWERCVPDAYGMEGRPVRLAIREGATIYELRPWRIEKGHGGLGQGEVRRALEDVFSLGGELPVSEQTKLGERQMAQIERMFSRRLGWYSDICENPRARPDNDGELAAVSKTIVVSDGFTDVDEGF